MRNCSVIIPEYNSKEFLADCITSIKLQSESNIEMLIVDDGSFDDSPLVCDKMAFSDSRIITVHKKNEGVSVARNVGIGISSGEYIGFVDSDDTISKDMFDDLYRKAKETGSDIVMCDATTVFLDSKKKEEDTITRLADDCTLDKQVFTPDLLMEMAGSACRCIYKRSLVKQYSIAFPIGIKFSEDRIFNILAMGYANRVEYIKKEYYNRLVHSESCVMSFHEDYFERVKNAYHATNTALDTAWDDEKYKKAYVVQLIVGAICSVYNNYYKTSTFSLKEKIGKTREICNDEELSDAITSYGQFNLMSKLILKKRVLLLSVAAKLANIKHKR